MLQECQGVCKPDDLEVWKDAGYLAFRGSRRSGEDSSGAQGFDPESKAALEEAAQRPRSFVVQESIELVEEELPCLSESGEVEWSRRYLSLGLFPTTHQTGALGRFSDGAVVNISQNGGVVPLIVLEEDN